MCIAIYKPAGKEVTEEALTISFKNNPDGSGLAFRTRGGRIAIHKGFFKLETFLKCYNKFKRHDMIIHSRIATSGLVNTSCCHPFPITNRMFDIKQSYIFYNRVMAHNGTISNCAPDKGSKISDTMIFDRDILSKVDYHNPVIRELIDKFIGQSRVVIMDEKGFHLFGKWIEEEGVFYSNETFKKIKEPKAEAWQNTPEFTLFNMAGKQTEVEIDLRKFALYTWGYKDVGNNLIFTCGLLKTDDIEKALKELYGEHSFIFKRGGK